MNYKVTFEGSWSSGDDKPAAVLRLTIEELEDRLQARFRSGQDDLDFFLALGLQLESGRLVLLQRHVGTPNRGVAVYVDKSDVVEAALDELKACLDLVDEDFQWTARPPGPLVDSGPGSQA